MHTLRLAFPIFLAAVLTVCLGGTTAWSDSEGSLRKTPVVQAVGMTSPAVVNIQAAKTVEQRRNPFAEFFGSQGLFEPFFQDGLPQRQRRKVQKSLGSGVIIDSKQRLVLTNAHVITGASNIGVRLLDGREFEAELVGSDPDFDLAVLELSGSGEIPQASLGRSDDLMPGETVIAIGNPYGFSHTVTTGVISALNRSIQTKHGSYMGFVQTDAAINPGNSGGPLLNIAGEVIGITTAMFAQAQGIGFAIPIDKARRVVDELVSHGQVHPVWLGLSGQNLDQRTASYLGLETTRGLLVTRVFKGSPAHRHGLQSGDVLLALEGTVLEDKKHYLSLMRNVTGQERLTMRLWRNGQRLEKTLSPARFGKGQVREIVLQRWGLSVAPKASGQGLRIDRIRPGSPAESLGLQAGDLIYKIAGQPLKTFQDFQSAFLRYRLDNSVILLVVRDGQGYYLRLRV